METSGLLLYHGAMKYTVTNNSSAPQDLMTLKGRVVALPGKPVDAYFDAGIAGVYALVPFFEVKQTEFIAANPAPEFVSPAQSAANAGSNHRDPLDYDGDGRKGGSLPKRGPGRPRKES